MGVEFNENKTFNYNDQSSRSGGMVGFIIKTGLAKDEKGAQKVLIGIAILFFFLAIFIGFK